LLNGFILLARGTGIDLGRGDELTSLAARVTAADAALSFLE